MYGMVVFAPKTGYNPVQSTNNCSKQCGDIRVEFPYGLEKGCCARSEFLLNCTEDTPPVLKLNDYDVSNINISGGLITIKYDGDDTSFLGIFYEKYFPSSQEYTWAVANLTCEQAQQNKSGYACVDPRSECSGVTSLILGDYIGYRCICKSGFQGNPYIPDGCEDVDECGTIPNICKEGEKCHNIEGSYNCIPQRNNLILGLVTGLSVAFGILLLGVVASLVIRRWKSDVEKKLRRKHFLWEFKARPLTEIVAAQVREEAREEEINGVASLAEMCLRLRGEERPTMKEVEMTLQMIRMKRLKSYQIPPESGTDVYHLLRRSRAKDSIDQSFVQELKIVLISYSLEQEFIASAEMPR
ncbi:hypothetical protein EJB05_33035, partial [Eragrostis curvula]